MKNTDDFTYDSNGCIRHKGWKLWPWPLFQMDTITARVEVTAASALAKVLAADDVFCLLWKGQIPNKIIHYLSRYPAILPEALIAAQRNPKRFLQLCEELPFAAMLLWSVESADSDVGSLLAAARLPCDRESVGVLSRIPASACDPEITRAMQRALLCPLRRRLLIRTEVIDGQIYELMRLPVNDRRVQDALAGMIREEAQNGAL